MTRCFAAFAAAVFSLAAFADDPNPPSIYSDRGAWPICRQWTVAETQRFARWIEHIYDVKAGGAYEQRIARIERILTDPAINLLLSPEFAGEGCNEQLDAGTLRAMHNVLDCAKLTVTLSAYYAYKRALPWMFSYVRACDGADVRTADYTIPGALVSSLDYNDAGRFFRDALTGTCTGNFRVELNRERSELSDTVPVAITRKHLLPGSLFYLDGHVLILAHISPHGELRFLDATVAPSRDVYAFNGFNVVAGVTGKRSEAGERAYDGCYRGFLVHRWPFAEVDEQGRVVRVRRRTNAEMREFGISPEQYEKIEELTETGAIIEDGLVLNSFQQFVRMRLRSQRKINLATDIKDFADEMSVMLQERERRVQQAWNDVLMNGPIAFPEDRVGANVYTAGGRWGMYATAMDDVAMRGKYFSLIDHVNNAIAWFEVCPDDLELDAFNKHAIWFCADLADAALRAKRSIFSDTPFEYRNARGETVRLTLLDVENRLYDLSFDPNHPPELRWGEPIDKVIEEELPETGTPVPGGGTIPMRDAYRREAYYRSLTHWEPEPSMLRDMFTDGFPMRDRFDAALKQKWFGVPSSPIVPRGGREAWLAAQTSVKER